MAEPGVQATPGARLFPATKSHKGKSLHDWCEGDLMLTTEKINLLSALPDLVGATRVSQGL